LGAEEITYLIYFIGYQYYFAGLKLYALFTLHITSWGTREGVAGGVKQELKSTVDAETKMEQKLQMSKRARHASKTYQKGDIALMRRVHNYKLGDDQVWPLAHAPPPCQAAHATRCVMAAATSSV
jgi:hypothetical protein